MQLQSMRTCALAADLLTQLCPVVSAHIKSRQCWMASLTCWGHGIITSCCCCCTDSTPVWPHGVQLLLQCFADHGWH